jgi:hypothetical protein
LLLDPPTTYLVSERSLVATNTVRINLQRFLSFNVVIRSFIRHAVVVVIEFETMEPPDENGESLTLIVMFFVRIKRPVTAQRMSLFAKVK